MRKAATDCSRSSVWVCVVSLTSWNQPADAAVALLDLLDDGGDQAAGGGHLGGVVAHRGQAPGHGARQEGLPLQGRVVGQNANDLARIPNVISIAAEASKVTTILGALRTGTIDTLATTASNAMAVLNLDEAMGGAAANAAVASDGGSRLAGCACARTVHGIRLQFGRVRTMGFDDRHRLLRHKRPVGAHVVGVPGTQVGLTPATRTARAVSRHTLRASSSFSRWRLHRLDAAAMLWPGRWIRPAPRQPRLPS